MKKKIIILLFLILYSLHLVSCQSGNPATTIPYKQIESSTFANSPKIGVAILQNVQKEKLPYSLTLEMSGMISNTQENLKVSDWKPNDIIEWIPTYLDGSFDDTHDYLSNPKKNILEIQTILTYKSGLGSEVFHALTFSLIPRVFDYKLQMKSYFYDSDGIRHELMNTESFSIVDKQGKLVDHDAVDNNAEQQIKNRLAEMIQKSHSMIREIKISHTNFEALEKKKNTNPFLLSIDFTSCSNKYQFDYGPGVLDTVEFDNKEYSFCRTELHFYNQTKKTLSIDPKDFYLLTNSDQIQALESIPVMYVESRGSGNFLRKNTTRNFSKSVILNTTDKSSDESMELFFMVPKVFDRSNVRIRWKSPNPEPQIVEGWIGEIEVK